MVKCGWITQCQIGCARVLVEVVSWEVSYDDRVEVAKMTEWGWIRGLARSTEYWRVTIFGLGMKKCS